MQRKHPRTAYVFGHVKDKPYPMTFQDGRKHEYRNYYVVGSYDKGGTVKPAWMVLDKASTARFIQMAMGGSHKISEDLTIRGNHFEIGPHDHLVLRFKKIGRVLETQPMAVIKPAETGDEFAINRVSTGIALVLGQDGPWLAGRFSTEIPKTKQKVVVVGYHEVRQPILVTQVPKLGKKSIVRISREGGRWVMKGPSNKEVMKVPEHFVEFLRKKDHETKT